MRQREDFKDGTLGANLLTTVTTIDFGSDPGFATIAAPDYAAIIIDPEGAGNGPEVVYLTAFTATQTTGTITRGEEGTSDPGVTHASGTAWRHGPTIEDFNRFLWAIEAQDLSADANVDINLANYESIEIVGWLKPANDGVNLNMRLSNDGGSTFEAGGSDYTWVDLYVSTTTGVHNDTADDHGQLNANVGNGAGEFVGFKISIIGCAHAGVKTTTLADLVRVSATAVAFRVMSGVTYNTEEVNDYLRLYFSAGNIATGRIAVYGYPTP